MKYAEDFNYFDTTVHPAKSLGEIQELLDDFGATKTMVTQGQSAGKFAWMIRFEYQEHSYRFIFLPLPCRNPDKLMSFAGKKRTMFEQSRWQMGRIAAWFVKAILTAAVVQEAALFGFLELPGYGTGTVPPVASELKIDHLVSLLPDIKFPLLESGEG